MAIRQFVKTSLPTGAPLQGLALAVEANRLLTSAGYTRNGQAIVKKPAKVKCQGTDKRKTPKRQAIVKPADPFLLAWEAALCQENEKREASLRAQMRAQAQE